MAQRGQLERVDDSVAATANEDAAPAHGERRAQRSAVARREDRDVLVRTVRTPTEDVHDIGVAVVTETRLEQQVVRADDTTRPTAAHVSVHRLDATRQTESEAGLLAEYIRAAGRAAGDDDVDPVAAVLVLDQGNVFAELRRVGRRIRAAVRERIPAGAVIVVAKDERGAHRLELALRSGLMHDYPVAGDVDRTAAQIVVAAARLGKSFEDGRGAPDAAGVLLEEAAILVAGAFAAYDTSAVDPQ